MEALGGTPGVTDARPADTNDAGAYAQSEPPIADAGAQFGASVAQPESEVDFAARQERRQFIAARTQAITGLIGLHAQYAADPDYTTVKQRWIDDAAKTVDDAAALISSEPVRLTYYDSLHEPLMQERRNFARQAFQGVADAHAAHREQLLQQLEQNLSTDPDHALSIEGWNIVHSNIDDAVDKRFITPEQASIERKAAALRLTAASYKKLAQENPARAIAELTAEESPHPLVQFLPTRIKDSLVSQAQLNARAGQLDAKRNAALADQKDQQAAAQSNAQYIKLAFVEEPDLAVRIANDATLTAEDKNGLLDTLSRTTQSDPPAAGSKTNTLKFLDRIRRTDGDPEKIVDPNEILEAYNRREIGKQDYESLTAELTEASTPDGAELAAMKRAFMHAFKPVVDPHSPDAGAVAIEQTYQLEQALAQRIARMRAAGFDPRALFDPSTPHYIESYFDLVPQFILNGTPNAIVSNPVPPQVPSETGGDADVPNPVGKPQNTPPTTPSELPIVGDSPPDTVPGPIPGPADTTPQPIPPQAPPTDDSTPGSPVETPRGDLPPQTGQAAPSNQGVDHTSKSPPAPPAVGFIQGGLRDALTKIGLDPERAEDAAAAITTIASLSPVLGVPLALDDLHAAARNRDLSGIGSRKHAPRRARGATPKTEDRKIRKDRSATARQLARTRQNPVAPPARWKRGRVRRRSRATKPRRRRSAARFPTLGGRTWQPATKPS
jgi:hypothetical protein